MYYSFDPGIEIKILKLNSILSQLISLTRRANEIFIVNNNITLHTAHISVAMRWLHISRITAMQTQLRFVNVFATINRSPEVNMNTPTTNYMNHLILAVAAKCSAIAITQMMLLFYLSLMLAGPRWASWNLGVFLCIRCAGIHRNLGVHISRVKSVNLDSWTPEQVVSLQQMGNSRARAVYEAQLPDGFRRPQTDSALESFIRAKYEHKKYVAREWVQPPPVKANWDKEIEEEMEKQKRKKKGLGIASITATSNGKQSTDTKKTVVSLKSTPLPAPLPKPTVSPLNNNFSINSFRFRGIICEFHFDWHRIIQTARRHRHASSSIIMRQPQRPAIMRQPSTIHRIYSAPICWDCRHPLVPVPLELTIKWRLNTMTYSVVS